MAGIQASNGIVTGIDIQGTVDQLMNLAAAPRTRLTNATKQIQAEQLALTSLTALVVGVQLSTDRLGQASLFSSTTATSSSATTIKASVSGSPKPGSHSFIPVRQASAQQLTSSLLTSKEQLVGAGEVVIYQGGFLDESASLDQLNGGAGVARGSIRVTDRSGASKTIDLRFAQNVNDVVDAINKTDGIQVVASVDGDRLKIADTSSGSGTLSVSEVSGGTTAADLGLSAISTSNASATGTSIQSLSNRTALSSLLDKRGLVLPSTGAALKFDLRNGESVSFTSALNPNNASIGDLLTAINTAGNGKLSASISADGKSIDFKDLTTGSGSFGISSPEGGLANALGINASSGSDTIKSGPLIAGLNDVLLSSLNGGKGLGTLGKITLTDRANVSATIDLGAAKTLGDVIDTINDAGNGVRARLNRTRTGIEIVDTTGSTTNPLAVTNFADSTETATKLKIAASVSSDAINSGSLDKQWLNENTQLKDWNQGKGITFGSIRITDSAGKESAINLAQSAPKTVGDVLKAINKLNIGVEAKINEAGDGILIVDTIGGSSKMKVVDVGNSISAKLLGIAGTAKELTVDGETVDGIDGTRSLRIETTATTTVTQLTEKLNALEGSVSANLISFGSSGVRLVLNGTQTGAAGRVAVDSDLNLGFAETVTAKDALLAYGASETSGGVLVSSSTNQFTNVVDGVRLDVLATSTTPVTISVNKSSDGIAKQLRVVVDQYNKVRDKIKSDGSYDEASKSAGVLFGSSSILRIDLSYGKLFTGRVNGAGDIKSITQLGVRLNDQGKLEFDESKLNDALAANPEAVQEFFTKEKTGFSAKAKEIADTLAGVKNGSILSRTQSLQAKIEQNNVRINNFTAKLDKQRARLLNQFYNLEKSISGIRNNLNAISSINTDLSRTSLQ